MIPSWTFTLRGQLLPSEPEVQSQPMTSYFKSIIIEFDRASDAYAEPNRVEWHKTNDPAQKMYDYIQCTRKGDNDVNIKVSLTVDSTPERYKLSDEFAEILQLREETRPGIVMALWQYIKVSLSKMLISSIIFKRLTKNGGSIWTQSWQSCLDLWHPTADSTSPPFPK